MNSQEKYATLGIDIGSTTVKIAILDENHNILFSDYERHFANIRETLSALLKKAYDQLGELQLHPMITGSGGLTLANHLGVPFTQEVVAVATSLQELAPKTDVAIELGGEDAKISYFEGGNGEQRMNGICAGLLMVLGISGLGDKSGMMLGHLDGVILIGFFVHLKSRRSAVLF